MTRARALLITPILPSRTGNGLAMRIMLFVEAIETFADLDILVVPLAGHPIASPPTFRASTSVSIVEPSLDRGFALIGRIPSHADRLSAFAHYGRPSVCGSLSPRTLDAVIVATEGRAYDLIHVARSYMMPVTAVLDPDVPLSLDLDEDDRLSVLSLSRIARRKGDRARADWLAVEAEAFDRLIARTQHRTLTTFVSNEADRVSLMARHPGLDPRTIVNAVEIPPVVDHDDDGRTIAFVGTLGFEPNVDGLIWFATRVLPRLRALTTRRISVLIAGAAPPPCILALGKDPSISILGDIAHVGEVYRRATIAIAPMRTGGGLRTKIVEAAAHGIACVAHRSSVRGLPANIGWVAGSATAFAAACADALDNTSLRTCYEAAAAHHARTHFDRALVIARLAPAMAALIR